MRTLEAGTKITCENGHFVATLAKPLSSGEVVTAGVFKFADGQECLNGEAMRCRKCEASWGSGSALHTEDGWLPE